MPKKSLKYRFRYELPETKEDDLMVRLILEDFLLQNNLIIEKKEYYYLYECSIDKNKKQVKTLLIKRHNLILVYEYAIATLLTKKLKYSRTYSLSEDVIETIKHNELSYSSDDSILDF